jgi:hypothetical protein
MQLRTYIPSAIMMAHMSIFIFFIRHCFICRPANSTVSKDAVIEPGTIATLTVRRPATVDLIQKLELIPNPRSHIFDYLQFGILFQRIYESCWDNAYCNSSWTSEAQFIVLTGGDKVDYMA